MENGIVNHPLDLNKMNTIIQRNLCQHWWKITFKSPKNGHDFEIMKLIQKLFNINFIKSNTFM